MPLPKSVPAPAARALLALALAASVAAPSGCSATDAGAPASATMDEAMPHLADPTTNPVPPAVMARLYDEVAADSGVNRDAIVLVQATRATWPDTSRGCPQPNVGYAQVITQGYHVVLRVGRQDYDFRVGPDLDHFRCTGATRQAPIIYRDT